MKRDDETTIQELKDLIIHFQKERGWGAHHTPRNLATSISIEAAELLEHFQWGEYSDNNKQAIADELADILSYCFNLAATLGIDVATAFRDKVARVAEKYPTSIFNPESTDNKADYNRIKQAYRAGKKPKGTT
jgi:dCTP diphosphatase